MGRNESEIERNCCICTSYQTHLYPMLNAVGSNEGDAASPGWAGDACAAALRANDAACDFQQFTTGRPGSISQR